MTDKLSERLVKYFHDDLWSFEQELVNQAVTLEQENEALRIVYRRALAYRQSTTNWAMDEDDHDDLVRSDGVALDTALKKAGIEHD